MSWLKIDHRRWGLGTILNKVENIEKVIWEPHIETFETGDKFCFILLIISWNKEEDGKSGDTFLVHLDIEKSDHFEQLSDQFTTKFFSDFNERIGPTSGGNFWKGFIVQDFETDDKYLQSVFDEISHHMKVFYL